MELKVIPPEISKMLKIFKSKLSVQKPDGLSKLGRF